VTRCKPLRAPHAQHEEGIRVRIGERRYRDVASWNFEPTAATLLG
jgi:hypothetical protein